MSVIIPLEPGSRVFLLDLDAMPSARPRLLAAACKTLRANADGGATAWTVEGVGNTPAILLIAAQKPPRSIQLDQHTLDTFTFNAAEGLLYIRFPNEPRPRKLVVEF